MQQNETNEDNIMSYEEFRNDALKSFNNLNESDKLEALKHVRLQSVLIAVGILDDYCYLVKSYHNNIVEFISKYMPESGFIKQLDSIDTFADYDVYNNKLTEFDINSAMYMLDKNNLSDNVKNGYNPFNFTLLQISYSYWIRERNLYLDFIKSAFEDDVDKMAIDDIVKNNTDKISIKIADYIDSKIKTIQFSDCMGDFQTY